MARKAKPTSDPSEIPNKRLSDIAYERVLEALFERRVEAGAFVSQSELSSLVDVPVAPLRDALRMLEAEGILSIHPRSGIQFVKPGLELTRATYQFRSIIERTAVRLYAEQGDEQQIATILNRHLALIVHLETHPLSGSDLQELDDLERVLHLAVISILRNVLIETSYRRMHNYLRLLRLDRRMTTPLALRTLKEHVDILKACQDRDATRAEQALDAHFQAALQRSLGLA